MTDEEERAMVDSELLRMLEDVANREIPCTVAYADIQKRIAAAKAEERERIQKSAYRCKPGEMLHINNSIPMLVLVSSVINPEDTDFEPKHYRCVWNREPFTSCEDYRKAGGQAEHCPWFEDKDDQITPTVSKPAMTPEQAAAQHKMVEAFTKSVDDIMIQAINFKPDKE